MVSVWSHILFIVPLLISIDYTYYVTANQVQTDGPGLRPSKAAVLHTRPRLERSFKS